MPAPPGWPGLGEGLLARQAAFFSTTNLMNNLTMPFTNFLRSLIAGSALLALIGCASLPPQQSYNRDANQHIKTIAVLSMRETEAGVFIMNNPGMNFGLIGGLIAEADLAAKRKKLQAALNSAGVDYVAVFKDEFTAAMSKRGYTLIWPESTIETTKAARSGNGIRKAYSPVAKADAQLDVNFGFFGYAAGGAGAGSPYRPTGVVTSQLVSADGKTKLFADTVVYHNVFNVQQAIVINPDERISFPKFSDLEAGGDLVAEGIELAATRLADKLSEQL